MEFVEKKLSEKPVTKDDVIEALNREIIPVVKALRASFNDVVDTTDIAAPVTLEMSGNELIVFVDTSAASWSPLDIVELPAEPELLDRIYVIDTGGNAAVNSIVVEGSHLINGSSSASVIVNYGALSLVFNGTSWSLY